MKKVIFYLSFFLFFAISANAQHFDYSFKESYSISTPAKLKVTSNDGDIKVVAHDKKEIEVFYDVKKGNDHLGLNRQMLSNLIKDKMKLEVKEANGKLEIKLTSINMRAQRDWKKAISINFIIYVPAQTSCELYSSDGDITIKDLTLAQKCSTEDGSIELSNIGGEVSVKTQDGDIDMTTIAGDVTAKTNDGDIHLTSLGGAVVAKTNDGDIYLKDVKGKVQTKTSDGEVVKVD